MLLVEYQTPNVLVHINTRPDPIMFHYQVYRQIGQHIVLTQQGYFFVYHDTVVWGNNAEATLVINNSPFSLLTLPFPGLPEKDPNALNAIADKIICHAKQTS